MSWYFRVWKMVLMLSIDAISVLRQFSRNNGFYCLRTRKFCVLLQIFYTMKTIVLRQFLN